MTNDETRDPREARFSFESPDFSVEFVGSSRFVTEQIRRVAPRVEGLLAGEGVAAAGTTEIPAEPARSAPVRERRPAAASPSPAPSAAPAKKSGASTSPLEEFYRKSRTRDGRGALQDSILLFSWYLHERQGKPEFSIDDLNFCFGLLNIKPPKSLANTLGILRRDRGWLESGSRRGTYSLTKRGRELAAEIVGS